jgi:hypothetical protein
MIKNIDINRDKSFQKSGRVQPFLQQRKGEILEEMEVEPVG